MSFEWYNRDKKYKYGDYIKGKGYYNEDSNKWVSRLNNKVIVEKYIRYEFSNWDDKKILYEFGFNKIDKSFFFFIKILYEIISPFNISNDNFLF